MARARRTVDCSLAYGHPHLYSKSSSGTILQDVTMARMTGTLAQLGLVAHSATELFKELFSISEEMYERIEKAQKRTGALSETLPKVVAKVKEINGNAGGSSAPHEHSEPARIAFNESTMPRAMKERYEAPEVHATPDLSGVDELLPEELKDGPCGHKYSYPGLFLDQWAAEEMTRISNLKRKKAERKADKKERKKDQIKKIRGWRERYQMDDDEAKTHQQQQRGGGGDGVPSRITMERAPSEKRPQLDRSPSLIPKPPSGKKPPPPPPPPPKKATQPPPPPPPKKPPPPPPSFSSTDREDALPSKPNHEDLDASRPASVRRTTSDALPIVEEEQDESFAYETDAPSYPKFFKMLQMGIPKPAVQQKMMAEGLDPTVLDEESDDEESPRSTPQKVPPEVAAAPASDNVPAAESPPRPPTGLLGAIQQGAALKKVVETPVKAAAPKNDLLAAIKGGANLRKRDPDLDDAKPSAPVKPQAGGLFGAVDKILSLRQKIAADDDSDDDEWGDDDDEWDDEWDDDDDD
ncbi:hypothetical protein CTAYLR_001706 [Chrysophaeum taylorii]|uniref:WH2 domain-containing protein n=1 Tax=Chrysophaeum taylorii TaxID=2483200 RepID=A0AAD7XHI8_9STRA|nr:hypothetical protein CTAYLR_001706 [Chrysophaeum taylorii]